MSKLAFRAKPKFKKITLFELKSLQKLIKIAILLKILSGIRAFNQNFFNIFLIAILIKD